MRWHGVIGFNDSTETAPGVYSDNIVEKSYYGEVVRQVSRWAQVSTQNDNRIVNNSISVVADAYAFQNYYNIRYIEFEGVKWTVSSMELSRPRIIVALGEPYVPEETEEDDSEDETDTTPGTEGDSGE